MGDVNQESTLHLTCSVTMFTLYWTFMTQLVLTRTCLTKPRNVVLLLKLTMDVLLCLESSVSFLLIRLKDLFQHLGELLSHTLVIQCNLSRDNFLTSVNFIRLMALNWSRNWLLIGSNS